MFAIEIPYCDFNAIYFNHNQHLRWIRVDDNKYIIINGKNIVLAYQKKNKKYFICNEEDFYDKWYDYFDANHDYEESYFELKKFVKQIENKVVTMKADKNKDIRLVKMDIFEAMIAYCLDEDIFTKQKMKYLSEFGNKRHNTLQGLSINWYEFPTPKQLYYAEHKFPIISKDEEERINTICKNAKLIRNINIEDEEDVYTTLYSIYNNKEWIKRMMIYCFGFKNYFSIRDKDKFLFERIGISPKDFKGYKEKGLLLNYITGGKRWE